MVNAISLDGILFEHDRGESRRVMVTYCLVVGLPKACYVRLSDYFDRWPSHGLRTIIVYKLSSYSSAFGCLNSDWQGKTRKVHINGRKPYSLSAAPQRLTSPGVND